MSEDRDNHLPDRDEEVPSDRPAPRNPFADPADRQSVDEGPALIETRRSAAIAGIIVGLVALVLVVAICVAASMAFG